MLSDSIYQLSLFILQASQVQDYFIKPILECTNFNHSFQSEEWLN